jgi:hypothetical protein
LKKQESSAALKILRDKVAVMPIATIYQGPSGEG